MRRICPIVDRPTEVEPTEYSRGEWTIVRCKETGFVFLADPPDYEQLGEQFAWETTWQENRKQRTQRQPVVETASAMYKRLRKILFPHRNPFYALARDYAPPRDRLTFLDVGCGWGKLMEDLCERFAPDGRVIRPIGIEVSRQMAVDCHERFARLGGHVICSSALDGAGRLPPASIDVIVLSTFLEHEYQPLKLLRKLGPALVDDGAMLVKVPNFASWNRRIRGKRWPGFRYPDHVNYFTPATLARLVEEADLSLARQSWQDKLPMSDNMYAVLKKKAAAESVARAA